MLSPWLLPRQAVFGDKTYALQADFRDVLEIIAYLQDPDLPEFIRWQIALALFYEPAVSPEHSHGAMEYLAWFLTGGCPESDRPGPKLLDWQQDAPAIVSDVNKAAGQEIRALPFLHWWTFLSWFHAMGEGQVSTLVALRDKLRRGKKLEPHEQEFYRRNRSRILLRPEETPEELAQKEALRRLLDPPCEEREGEYAK